MKSRIFAVVVLGAVLLPLAAQQREEGVAICYDEGGNDGLYATHKTLPFGTKVTVVNPVNKSQVTVQIGGRPNPALNVAIEISQQTAARLGIYRDIPTWVWLTPEPQPTTVDKHVTRPKIGAFKQKGNASVLAAGNELTGSHTSLPMGTRLKVTNVENNRNISLTITNRIKASSNRIIELSRAAANALGIRTTAVVQIETVGN